MVFQEQCYMLGSFFPVDEIEPRPFFKKLSFCKVVKLGETLWSFPKRIFEVFLKLGR